MARLTSREGHPIHRCRFGFVARALDYGGLAFEDDRPRALAALEKGLREWFDEQARVLLGLWGRKVEGQAEPAAAA